MLKISRSYNINFEEISPDDDNIRDKFFKKLNENSCQDDNEIMNIKPYLKFILIIIISEALMNYLRISNLNLILRNYMK